jgi:hypothetical protein
MESSRAYSTTFAIIGKSFTVGSSFALSVGWPPRLSTKAERKKKNHNYCYWKHEWDRNEKEVSNDILCVVHDLMSLFIMIIKTITIIKTCALKIYAIIFDTGINFHDVHGVPALLSATSGPHCMLNFFSTL